MSAESKRVAVERPIVMSGPMVRAILEQRKTQARFVMEHQPREGTGRIFVEHYEPAVVDRYGEIQPGPTVFGAYDEDAEWSLRCPYGEPGDLLWVRETWRPFYNAPAGECIDAWTWTVKYAAGGDDFTTDDLGDNDWTYPKQAERGYVSPIGMPKWASRIKLLVKSIRVERLQSITEEDAIAEGVTPFGDTLATEQRLSSHDHRSHGTHPHTMAFASLWDENNASREGCSWNENPWVWVVEFEVVEIRRDCWDVPEGSWLEEEQICAPPFFVSDQILVRDESGKNRRVCLSREEFEVLVRIVTSHESDPWSKAHDHLLYEQLVVEVEDPRGVRTASASDLGNDVVMMWTLQAIKIHPKGIDIDDDHPPQLPRQLSSPSSKSCPSCRSAMKYKMKDDEISLHGLSRVIQTTAWWCDVCGEGVLDGRALASRDQAFDELAKGLVSTCPD